jgi:hypothetical protein
MTTQTASAQRVPSEAGAFPTPASFLGRARIWLAGAAAALLGLLPHLLHHAGPLAGAALLGGIAGSLLFGIVGAIAAIPFLLRLHRRSGDWRLPAAAMAMLMVVFSISTFVIGPAINSGDSGSSPPAASPQPNGSQTPSESESAHESHH